MKAPFPYFGGKYKIASMCWDRFGNVPNYVEPFFGSGAVLLDRPHEPGIETVNDANAFISNFWRAVQADPDEVAAAADWPVNETDLTARHRWLCRQPQKTEFSERMAADPDYYDAKRAGWWVWGLCSWIGAGWCDGEWFGENDDANHGRGVCNDAEKLSHLGGGRGVHRQRPQDRRQWLIQYMRDLSHRLRRVRVCCGDWTRVLTETPTVNQGTTAVFLDPPYLHATADGQTRDAGCYGQHDDGDVANAVRDWAVANGDNFNFRIALCGYDGEHVMPESWECVAWKANGGMANRSDAGTKSRANANRERVWFSPHCLKPNLHLF